MSWNSLSRSMFWRVLSSNPSSSISRRRYPFPSSIPNCSTKSVAIDVALEPRSAIACARFLTILTSTRGSIVAIWDGRTNWPRWKKSKLLGDSLDTMAIGSPDESRLIRSFNRAKLLLSLFQVWTRSPIASASIKTLPTSSSSESMNRS